MENSIVKILLVEDDTLDVMDVKRTFDRMGILNFMNVAKNGEHAMDILESKVANHEPMPDVILLDLNMPKMNGLEFLVSLRKNDNWKDIKVFVLTTSEEKEDKDRAKRLGISGYIVKPLKLNNPSSIDSFNLMIDLLNLKKGI